MGKRDVFELLDRDCVNSQTAEFIKNYINDIVARNNIYAMKNKNLGVELSRVQRTLNEERKLQWEKAEKTKREIEEVKYEFNKEDFISSVLSGRDKLTYEKLCRDTK